MSKITEFQTAAERRAFIEKKLDISLHATGSVLIDEEEQVHTENLIGAISLPLGVAGPVTVISTDQTAKNYFIPLATTEGALVASVNRGAKAISLSGGAVVRFEKVGATRGSVFETSGISSSLKLKTWIEEHLQDIMAKANATSGHLKLLRTDISITGDRVYVRFYYDTEHAMGMNMATIATTAVCEYIATKTGTQRGAVAANFDIDKKPAWLNFINGRGRRVWADVTIGADVIQNVLKTSSGKITEVWLSKCMIGSAMGGSLGFNSHFANIVAAFFAATGQDLAHVVEGSMGMTTTKALPDGALYISIYMPDIMLGTVGGGTGLKTQREARKICEVEDPDELAIVLGAGVLAGELSLLASLAEGSLARAHAELGR